MSQDQIIFKAIGTIHSPFTEPVGVPIQPAVGVGVKGSVVVDPDYQAGLQDLGGFSATSIAAKLPSQSYPSAWIR